MASKKVYFYEVKLFSIDNDEEQDYHQVRDLLVSVIDNSAVNQEGYRTLDITLDDNPLHVMLDVFDYNNGGLFCRLSRQRPKSDFIQRDYNSLEQGEILPGEREDKKGIEQCTYAYLNYETCILSIVMSMGAPKEKAFASLFSKYCDGYYVNLVAVPNANTIGTIYMGEEAEVSKISIEVPIPDAGILQQVFGWNNEDILNIVSQRAATIAIEVKPPEREKITNNSDDSQNLINCIRENIRRYQKAKIRAKAKNIKLQDFNFFEEYFSYPIDIPSYHVENYDRVYYSVDELVDLYRQNIINAYNDNNTILTTITGR